MSHKSSSEIAFRDSTFRSSSTGTHHHFERRYAGRPHDDLRSQKDSVESFRSRSVSDSKKKKKKRKRERSSSSSSSSPHRKKRKKSSSKSRRKKKHRKHSSSSSSSSGSSSSSDSSSSSESSPDEKKEKRRKQKHKKHSKKKKHTKKKRKKRVEKEVVGAEIIGPSIGPSLSLKDQAKAEGASAGARILKPMTKEEWEKKQSVIRRVYDPETGRNRLVKGDGEIIEEIVSRDRHKEINKQATLGDGLSYQAKVGMLK